ncbi:MAG: endonuclease III [Rhodothermales bacterium]
MTRTERAARTVSALRDVIDTPETELAHEDPYQLIVAVILSAQCTDARVNIVTPAFFEAFPTVEQLAEAEVDDVYPYIRSISFPNNKSRHLVKMARRIVRHYDGCVPDTVEELLTLQGVGRKTAQVVASVAYNRAALPVDTHVFRVANRIGLVHKADTPLKVERQLKRVVPRADWGEAHHLLILHGRYTCTARSPDCASCPLPSGCRYYERLERLPEPLYGLDTGEGAYYCKTRDHYFEDPDRHTDRYGVEQICCPRCGSMNVYYSETGDSTKKVKDYRV